MSALYDGTPEPTRAVMLKAALAYAERGVPVLPCKPDKSPYTRHGFKDATTNPSRITAWWNRWPLAKVGIPTGEVTRLLVVDEDRPGALDELRGDMTHSRTARTPRGGRHVYLRLPAGVIVRSSAGKIADGVDIRAEGGYVLAPPSTGYAWKNDAPIAEAPEWLLEALRTPERAATDDVQGERPPVSVEVAGDTIPDGERNATLARIAGKLHDGTRTAEQLVTDLEAVNIARCRPPLADAEAAKIARSIHAGAPCRPSTPKASGDVLEALDGIETAFLEDRDRWKGTGGGSPYSILAVLVKLARRHGKITEEGVRIAVSIRRLALLAGLGSTNTVEKALKRLDEAGIVSRVDKGDGPKAGAFVLKTGRAGLRQLSTRAAFPSTVSPSRTPLTAERLRWSKPLYASENGLTVRTGTLCRLGKKREQIVDFLEACPGGRSTVQEIADAFGMKRPRELTRRRTSPEGRDGFLPPLVDAGVIEISGDAVHLRLDWLAALDKRREEDEEIKDRERDRERYAEQTRLHKLRLAALKLWKVMDSPEEIARNLNASPGEVRHVLGLPAAPVRDEEPPRKEADGLIEDLERLTPVENAPTEGSGAAQIASKPSEGTPEGPSTLDRQALIAEAIEAMFTERPEYRRLRVGQVTCRLIGKDYVPLGFCPTDAEVESVLGEVAA